VEHHHVDVLVSAAAHTLAAMTTHEALKLRFEARGTSTRASGGLPVFESLRDEYLDLVRIEPGERGAIDLNGVPQTSARPVQGLPLSDAVLGVTRTGVSGIFTQLAAHRSTIGPSISRPPAREERAQHS